MFRTHIVDSLLPCCWTYSPLNKYPVSVLPYQSKCFKIVIKLLYMLNISSLTVLYLIFVHANLNIIKIFKSYLNNQICQSHQSMLVTLCTEGLQN